MNELRQKILALEPTDDDWNVVNAIQDANDDNEPEEFVEECEEECDWINYGNDLVYSQEHAEWVAWRQFRAKVAAYERIHGEISAEEWSSL